MLSPCLNHNRVTEVYGKNGVITVTLLLSSTARHMYLGRDNIREVETIRDVKKALGDIIYQPRPTPSLTLLRPALCTSLLLAVHLVPPFYFYICNLILFNLSILVHLQCRRGNLSAVSQVATRCCASQTWYHSSLLLEVLEAVTRQHNK